VSSSQAKFQLHPERGASTVRVGKDGKDSNVNMDFVEIKYIYIRIYFSWSKTCLLSWSCAKQKDVEHVNFGFNQQKGLLKIRH